MESLTDIFGPVIYSYTRNDAINDGTFIDVTSTARNWGLKIPVAVTATLFTECIKGQTETLTDIRLNIFLSKVYHAIRASKESRNTSCLRLHIDMGMEGTTEVIAVVEAQGPDDPSPAMNLFLPGGSLILYTPLQGPERGYTMKPFL